MFYNYFTLKKKHKIIIDHFNIVNNERELNKSILKKIGNLNTYQYLYILNNLIYHKPLPFLEVLDLKYFFKSNKRETNQFEFILGSENIVYEEYVAINFNDNLEDFVNYFIFTNEYPKLIQITKLLHLRDLIFEKNILLINSLKESFIQYHNNAESETEFEKIKFVIDIISEIKNYETKLYEITDKIQNTLERLKRNTRIQGNYLININKNILEELYKQLEKNNFIDIHKTSQENFIKVLMDNWEDHNSIIHLEMNNIQFKSFIDKFKKYFDINIPLTHIEFAENIYNKNGKIKANSIYVSNSKNNLTPKNENLLDSIFNNIKKVKKINQLT